MSTPVTITLIVCGTVVLLSVISLIGTAVAAKKASKNFKEFFKED